MLINKNTKIVGKNCILVPYRKEHVPKYHEWMKSEELQRLTASEPLSLDEEYEMQLSWQNDEDKCTFTILDKMKYEQTQDEIESMIGDTNLFFANPYDRICAEAEIMIAEEWARGKKIGKEAITLMFIYGIMKLNVKQFVVKITEDNLISMAMFTHLGFTEFSRSDIFHEITFNKLVDNEWTDKLKSIVEPFEINEK